MENTLTKNFKITVKERFLKKYNKNRKGFKEKFSDSQNGRLNKLITNTKYSRYGNSYFEVKDKIIYGKTYQEFNKRFRDSKFDMYFNDNVRYNEDTNEIYYIESKSKSGKKISNGASIEHFKGKINTTRLFYLDLNKDSLQHGKFYDMNAELKLPDWVKSIYQIYDIAMHPDGIFLSASCIVNKSKAMLNIPESQTLFDEISNGYKKERTDDGTKVLLVFFIPKHKQFKKAKLVNTEWYNDNLEVSLLMYGEQKYFPGLLFCKIRNVLYMSGVSWRNDKLDKMLFILYKYSDADLNPISRTLKWNQQEVDHLFKDTNYGSSNLGPLIMDDRNQEEDWFYLYGPYYGILKVNKDHIQHQVKQKLKVFLDDNEINLVDVHIPSKMTSGSLSPSTDIQDILIPPKSSNCIFFRAGSFLLDDGDSENNSEEEMVEEVEPIEEKESQTDGVYFNRSLYFNISHNEIHNGHCFEDVYSDFSHFGKTRTRVMSKCVRFDMTKNSKFSNKLNYSNMSYDKYWNFKYSFMTAMCSDSDFVYSISHDGPLWDSEQDVYLCITSIKDINNMKMIPLSELIPEQKDSNIEILSMVRCDNKLLLFNGVNWQGKEDYEVYTHKENLMFGIIEIDLSNFLKIFGTYKGIQAELLDDISYDLSASAYLDLNRKPYSKEEIENNITIDREHYSFEKKYHYQTAMTDDIQLRLPGTAIFDITVRENGKIIDMYEHEEINISVPNKIKNVNWKHTENSITVTWEKEKFSKSYNVVSTCTSPSGGSYIVYANDIEKTKAEFKRLEPNSLHRIEIWGTNELGNGERYILPEIDLSKN